MKAKNSSLPFSQMFVVDEKNNLNVEFAFGIFLRIKKNIVDNQGSN